ncbi:ATP-binding cassette domain-containing protein [Micromonospora gifhornensis]|uniref:NHLM bacteriocin system ABC transporter, ATP-binding protein n=1 Tax=Micromonospora gifhornensis TaxID=84594 RepID=A0ABQ4IBW6_9ACTN|nr:ATP-binding cassette domain-containing protein [Micromonospora gifhornensis]GIJ15417.1 hypothetical protein Vgi01_21010 [Micromonospora gifhornensis]
MTTVDPIMDTLTAERSDTVVGRATADLAAVDEAWRRLAAAAAERPERPDDDAARILAAHYDLPPPTPGTGLVTALRAAGLHWTEVRLDGRWYRRGAAPLIVFPASGPAVALLPARRGYRTADGRRVTAADAGEYGRTAWQVYPPLSAGQPVTTRHLLRFAAQGTGPDLRFLLAAGLLAALIGGVLPFLSAWIITGVAGGSVGGHLLWSLAALIASFVVANALLLSARNAALVRLQGRLQLRLEPAVWSHLLSRDLRALEEMGTSDLVQRANSVTEMRKALSDSVAAGVLGSAFGLVSLAALIFVDPVVGGCVLGATVLLMAAASYAAIRQQRHELANREAFAAVAGFLHTALLAIEKIQVAAREERIFAGWAQRYARQRSTDAATLRWQARVAACSAALQPILLATLGIVVALRQDVALGTFVAASIAVGQFAASVGMLQGGVISAFSLVAAYRRLVPVLTAPPDVAPGAADPGRLRGRVQLHEVTFTYPGTGRPVLDRVSITAEPGEFIAVVGPSGAGKSTLIRLLLGLVPPSSGAVRYDGRDLSELDVRAVRAQLGVVLQQARAVRGSIRDNVAAGTEDLTDEAIWQALRLAGLADEVRDMPMGLHTMVSEDNKAFSGGQIQRLMVARALAKQPPVLVLDEATSALDNITQRKVTDRIADLAVTRIVVAHRLSTIRAADRIYVLDNGRIVAEGTFDHLVATAPLFARLVARQEVT